MDLCASQMLCNFSIASGFNARKSSSISKTSPFRLNKTLTLTYRSQLGWINIVPLCLISTTSEETSITTEDQLDKTPDEASTGEDAPVGIQKQTTEPLGETPNSKVEKFETESIKEKVVEDTSAVEKNQISQTLENLGIKVDFEDAYSIFLYGSGAILTFWLSSVVVGALDSIPLIPKIVEVIGLAYTIWFSYRYLLFKRNRDELSALIDELKNKIIGSDDN